MTIARDKLTEACRLHEEHPAMTWRQIGDALGEYGEAVRAALRQVKPLVVTKIPVGDNSEKEIVQFYLSTGERKKGRTARHFRISTWTVSKLLALAGYPEEASPSVVKCLEKANKLLPKQVGMSHVHQGQSPRVRYNSAAVVSFYFGEGQKSKKVTGRKFGISHWLVAKILALAGYPKESYPHILALLQEASGHRSDSAEGSNPPQDSLDYIREHWGEFIKSLHGDGTSGNLDAFLRSACAPLALEDNTLVLGFYYDFHRVRIDSTPYRELVEQRLLQAFGQPYHIRCVLVDTKRQVATSMSQDSTEGDGNNWLDQIVSRLQRYEQLKIAYAQVCGEIQELRPTLDEMRQRYDDLQPKYDKVSAQYTSLNNKYLEVLQLLSQPD